MTLKLPGNLLTTAMAVMPHTNVTRALELALSQDVPFWPQMPNYSYQHAFTGHLLSHQSKERTVQRSFAAVNRIADRLRDKHRF